MTNLLASPWIPLAVLLMFACGARVLARNWRAPSAFVLAIWAAYIIVPLAVAPEYRVSGLSVWTIVAMVACIALGAIVAEGKPRSKPPQTNTPIPLRRILLASLIFAGLGLVGAVEYLSYGLKARGLDFSLGGVLVLSHLNALDRYVGGPQPPWLVRLLVLWLFPAGILSGMSFALATTRLQRLLCFACLAPGFLYSIVSAARANTLILIALGIGAYLATRTVTSGTISRPISRKALLIGSLSIALAPIFFFAIDTARGHEEGGDVTLAIDWPRFKGAAIGYLAVYSDWADKELSFSASNAAMGAYTFGGIFDALGLHQRQHGVYRDFVNLDPNTSTDNNIYTAFRGVIEDFSFAGAIVFFLLIGFAAGHAYRRCALGRRTWAPSLALFYSFALWSPIISVLNYNGPLVAAIAGTMVVGLVGSGSMPTKQLLHRTKKAG